jgi:hypothetical protein
MIYIAKCRLTEDLWMLHKDYDRKGSVAKKENCERKRLGAKTN